jgi:hypothetical protein
MLSPLSLLHRHGSKWRRGKDQVEIRHGAVVELSKGYVLQTVFLTRRGFSLLFF